MARFFDTSSLLIAPESFLEEKFFCISAVSLKELDSLKGNRTKDEFVRQSAKRVIRWLERNANCYSVCMDDFGESVPDTAILRAAAYLRATEFFSEDISQRVQARQCYGLAAMPLSAIIEEEVYTGWLDYTLSNDKLAQLYENSNVNMFSCLPNQYLIVRNPNGEVVDLRKWDGVCYTKLKRPSLKTDALGDLKPYKGDVYQQFAIDSMATNRITLLKGPAGTGKSLLALAYLFKCLENGTISRIVVFCNPLATFNAAKLGYYPGTREAKILDSAPGAMLSSKIGDKCRVEQLCADGKLVLLPLSDIRGYDTTGMKAGVYIPEAQNMDISLAKLALQRIGEDSICVVEGDYCAQVDNPSFAGRRNGMKRISEVFRGQPCYGEVELRNIYRSEIARIAEHM